MQTYHCAVAIGHYARMLAAQYQVAAVLQALWLQAPDPFAHEAVVFVGADDLLGIVPNYGRYRQCVAALRSVGAVATERVSDGGLRLVKPPVDKLDAPAKRQIKRAIERAARLETRAAGLLTQADALRAQARSVVRPINDEAEDAHEGDGSAGARRREALATSGKQLSDVRNGLAAVMGLPKAKRDQLRYAGQGSKPVQFAADFIVKHSWDDFVRVCKAVIADQSPDKPHDMKWLFAERNADYLARFVNI